MYVYILYMCVCSSTHTYPWSTHPKTPSGCLKPRMVLDHISIFIFVHTVFSYVYIPMIKYIDYAP